MGKAIFDFHKTQHAAPVETRSSMFDDDEMDVSIFFRPLSKMSLLEQKAISLARGRVLDVGAGAGCHSLALQERLDVTAIDISPYAQQVMSERGVRDARCINLYDFRLDEHYDTILMLMNGSGIIGNMSNACQFFARMRSLLSHGGQILMDSSDLKYLYENEDGTYDIDPNAPYYGQIDYQMIYGEMAGEVFDWLYLDFQTLSMMAAANGFNCEKIAEGEHYDFLARLSLR